MAEQPNLNDACDHFDLRQELTSLKLVLRGRWVNVTTHRVRLLKYVPVERGVDDKIRVICNYRTSFCHGHAQGSFRRPENVVQILQDFGVSERDNFHRHT